MKIQDITTKQELAIFLGVKYRTLTYLLYYKKPESYYVSFTIPKKDGTARCINAPTGILKNIQQKLASRLYDEQKKYYTNSNKIPQGFIKERSILTNADCHKHKKYIVNIDLENYFNSIHFGRVQGYFENNRDFKLPRDVAIAMAQLVCYQGCLPQGAPTSPVLTNMICAIMDRKIIVVAKKYRVLYTRYADDMTFSTNDDTFEERLYAFLDELEKVINKSGFSINKKKTRFSKPSSRHEVTGLVVNQKVSIKREYYRLFRTLTDHLYKGEPILYQGRELTFSQLEGIAAFISHVYEKSNAPKNSKNSKGIARQIQQFLLCGGIFIMEKKKKQWPENCVWPKPLQHGEGDHWDFDDVDPMETDEEVNDLTEIKDYIEELIDEHWKI